MTVYEPTSGSIVHVELTSEDVEASRAFFAETFGWEIEVDEAMDYTIWRPPNPPGGALVAPQDGSGALGDGESQAMVPPEQPSTLFYVDVEDLAATREAIVDAGGEVLLAEMEVPEMGIFTVFREPGGVVEAAWETLYEGDASEDEQMAAWYRFTDEPEPGSVTHFEFYSADPEATLRFHEAVFGWEFETVGAGDYTMIRPPTPPYGGVMAATEEMPVGTLLYLLVEGAEAACAAVEESGGAVLREPFDVEGWGKMAVFEAPDGVVLALWESTTATADAASSEKAPGREVD